ncbi:MULTISPECIES: photosynthetic complex assembly protein PuhC [unclassified Dinoroseobacter]|uniref:photosynthetic complex assembly protein PuhC n=1 Tax=unclassified Dinoroseobacter TaxID=2620028 RepID=UPI003C7ECB08
MNDPATHELARRDREMIPTLLLRAMLFLVLACLAIVAYARVTDRPLEAQFPDQPILEEREIQIFGEMSGAARVLDGEGRLIADLSPQEGGFIAGMTRALARERMKVGVSETAPVRIVRYEDGHLALIDEATGWEAQLIGFGKDNTAAFERLLYTPIQEG